ncbi:ras association domain-containing protein 5 isoform X1 [Balearica regulorum gibbericeps]|uniref:ras association domain-containing protein 5 isoform X1 n=1 Tax=Balearica regulorum gibbericeps TaxID=100784 RepID=UPI003F5DDA69
MASPAVGPCPRPLPPFAPGSMRRRPPGSAPRPASPAVPPEPMGGRSPGSPGGARAARRLRRRGGAPRLLPDVRSIFAAPREPVEHGRGHRFAFRPPRRGWCDLCGEEVRERALRCDYCRYTCHQECRSLIQLDCCRPGQCQSQLSPEGTLLPPCSQNVTQTVEEEKPEPPTIQEIKQKIEKYNAKVTNCLLMKLNDDGTYTGFIKVHLKLRRPVTVPAGIRPQSIYDALKEVNLADMTDKRTSFYLPLDAIKQLHISSTTTVSEVIQGLLKKFMVVDNPQKFALFKEMRKDGQVLLQKLPLTEYPLYLRLLAGPDTDVLSFVLKENETGEVEWDAFSIPELQNFLMILDKEEKDKIQQVQRKYEKFKQRLQQTLKEARGKPG